MKTMTSQYATMLITMFIVVVLFDNPSVAASDFESPEKVLAEKVGGSFYHAEDVLPYVGSCSANLRVLIAIDYLEKHDHMEPWYRRAARIQAARIISSGSLDNLSEDIVRFWTWKRGLSEVMEIMSKVSARTQNVPDGICYTIINQIPSADFDSLSTSTLNYFVKNYDLRDDQCIELARTLSGKGFGSDVFYFMSRKYPSASEELINLIENMIKQGEFSYIAGGRILLNFDKSSPKQIEDFYELLKKKDPLGAVNGTMIIYLTADSDKGRRLDCNFITKVILDGFSALTCEDLKEGKEGYNFFPWETKIGMLRDIEQSLWMDMAREFGEICEIDMEGIIEKYTGIP